jgi:XTP/dITP diphosphohydrolase
MHYAVDVKLLVATTNRHKVQEIKHLLAGLDLDIVTLEGWPGLDPPEEIGHTFEENARAKAAYYSRVTQQVTVAEDSGLEIDALGGAPGVESARYGGERTSYPAKFALIYRALEASGHSTTTARFVCAVVLMSPEGVLFEARGTVEGRISPCPKGVGGFGYDPIFFYPPYGRTLGEVTAEEKAAVSHRGEAFRKLKRFLEGNSETSNRGGGNCGER